MSLLSEHEKAIQAYIDSNSDAKTSRVKSVEIEGKYNNLEVYRIPIKFLAFNTENGRFAADIQNLEKDLGHKLNAWQKKDADKIQKILLEKYPSETKRLREDLRDKGQAEPGLITAAGIVINANRRMAILKALYEETTKDKFEYLEVAILPRHLQDTEIYKIEARLQYARDFKAEYGPVNELLKIREGKSKGMSDKELADLLGQPETYVKEHLEQLVLLEAYSKHVWGKIDYKKIEEQGITEAMTDVAKNIRKFHNDQLGAVEIKKMTEVQFEYIRAGAKYTDIRAIGRMNGYMKVRSRYYHALEELKKKGNSIGDISRIRGYGQ